MVGIAIVDDHPVIVAGIRSWCADAEPPIEVIAWFEHPDELFDAPDALARADVVVADLQFGTREPDTTAVQRLSDDAHRVVVYSQHTEPGLVRHCLNLGAVTYLSKGEGDEHLIHAVRAAARDRPYHGGPTMAKMMTSDATADRPRLTEREREVLLAWFQSESKVLVAQKLFLSVSSIDTYLERIRTRYAAVGRPAPTKAALVARAISDGLIAADEF
ncbi:response regulator transcription factor [Nocardia arizonensis]|uniref:response regulator transcription factor n=1 Tax=Nocardia arizonensis TaxID=1141647 RepID=UPI0006D17AD7|nr:response regulator transcription factor [Nocardia arizonensis]